MRTFVEVASQFFLVILLVVVAFFLSFLATSGADFEYFKPTTSQCIAVIHEDNRFLNIFNNPVEKTRTEYCKVVKVGR